MVQSKVKAILPSGAELPDSDDTPVDNEEQNLLPNLLLFVLNHLWKNHRPWYFGVDMGVYHATGKNPRVPVVPDAFLSIGVERFKNNKPRRSYVVWEEEDIVPTLVIEMVSWSPGGEYDRKLEIYRKLGVLYYVIYNPEHWKRDGHQPFEVYKLIEGYYQLQSGEPYWMPEAELGIGRHQGDIGGRYQEILCWFEADGTRILMMEERAEKFQGDAQKFKAEAQKFQGEAQKFQGEAQKFQGEAQKFQTKAERLAARLRELGEDPNDL